MANKYPNYSGTVRMQSIYRMSDAPPNWAQDDPTQPDYIANKDEAEKLRPISVNGELLLNDTHESGGLNFAQGDNITLTTDADTNTITISAKATPPTVDTVRPVYVGDEEILTADNTSGALKFVAGANVILSTENNEIKISAAGSGGGPGEGGSVNITDGYGIDITYVDGQNVISLEKGKITDDYIASVSFEKIKMPEKTTLILNGGNANG